MTSFFFAGNKIDRDDVEIPTEVGDEFAQRHGMYFLETSAKASDNVERLFTEIAQDLLQVSTFLEVTQNSGFGLKFGLLDFKASRAPNIQFWVPGSNNLSHWKHFFLRSNSMSLFSFPLKIMLLIGLPKIRGLVFGRIQLELES